MIEVMILNGGSSSGKNPIAKCLQNSLPTSWLRFSIDDLIDAMPAAMFNTDRGIKFDSNGSVNPGTEFRSLESAWMHGIAEMVRGGARIIIDDVFITGIEAYNLWQVALEGCKVLWVGVFCEPAVSTSRETNGGPCGWNGILTSDCGSHRYKL